ncbi:hypothetical protein PHJA_000442200 [Phtheirospermum japonicum]|uniref:Uncharacterized protein n=1 Tax=Phtheirospermum japonicum TaxID=374723 RepID=A0A830BLP3_9LAMI|nr:hypothetical protein PHJA_000442200 [Phtheirospermum japonicum]
MLDCSERSTLFFLCISLELYTSLFVYKNTIEEIVNTLAAHTVGGCERKSIPQCRAVCAVRVQMNGVHHNGNKNHDFEKIYPGCLGRMTDLFELNIGVPTNTLLNDKPHRGGSPLSRSRSDGSRKSPSSHSLEETEISNRKSNVMPMKTLIAQEMSAEVDPRWDPPNLVAKLMGIDALPQQKQQQSPKSLRKGRYEEETIINDRKMNLVRQKFIEAKRLSMDEKLRQSKQFQDALDVLSSNKDLFLKCLQEPNSTFSQPLYGSQSVETNRITVLRPSKVAANINDLSRARYVDEKQIKRGTFLRPDNLDENATQPTRIVVLKPSPGKLHNNNNIKAVGPAQSNLPNVLLSKEFLGDEEDDECRESREVAKAITQQMREKLGNSSVFSNGYVGDESSFSKSEIECAMSPVSRHSWDYGDRLGSPYASSSFARASYSPESSVCREAKKRLSERWATMASSGSCREQRHSGRGSSTLGDMLALFDEPKNSDVRLVSAERREEENVDYSPRNLMRSKSVPVSSTEFGIRVNLDASVSDERKPESPKEDRKEGSVKSSLRGKVSSLFFSRNKKIGKNKSLVAEIRDEIRSDKTESPLEPNLICQQGMMSPETGSAVAEPIARENHDQPSPISVLDPPLAENEHSAKVLSHYVKPHDQYGLQDETQPNSTLARWHSSDSPLNPSLRDTYVNELNKQWQRRSTQKLVFDCVNEVLIEIEGCESYSCRRAIRADNCILDLVWARVKVWFYSQEKCMSGDNDLVVEQVVKKEVMGKGWNGNFRSEMDNLMKEIGGELLEELVQETVVELTGRESDYDFSF